MIAAEVMDRETHEARLADPDGYRPSACAHCRHGRQHAHDYPERVLRGEPDVPAVRLIRHRCVRCGATWRTLPGFVAVALPRSWPVVAAAVSETPPARGPAIPARTRRRWQRRLRSLARVAVAALATRGDVALSDIAKRVGLDATRAQLRVAFGAPLAIVAATLWRLVPGLRLM